MQVNKENQMPKKREIQQKGSVGTNIKEIKDVLNDIWTELTALNRLISIFENTDLLEFTSAQQIKLKNKAAAIKQRVTVKLNTLPF